MTGAKTFNLILALGLSALVSCKGGGGGGEASSKTIDPAADALILELTGAEGFGQEISVLDGNLLLYSAHSQVTYVVDLANGEYLHEIRNHDNKGPVESIHGLDNGNVLIVYESSTGTLNPGAEFGGIGGDRITQDEEGGVGQDIGDDEDPSDLDDQGGDGDGDGDGNGNGDQGHSGSNGSYRASLQNRMGHEHWGVDLSYNPQVVTNLEGAEDVVALTDGTRLSVYNANNGYFISEASDFTDDAEFGIAAGKRAQDAIFVREGTVEIRGWQGDGNGSVAIADAQAVMPAKIAAIENSAANGQIQAAVVTENNGQFNIDCYNLGQGLVDSIALSAAPAALEAMDLNGDGVDEILYQDVNGTLTAFDRVERANRFSITLNPETQDWLMVRDLNGDGEMELVVNDPTNGLVQVLDTTLLSAGLITRIGDEVVE